MQVPLEWNFMHTSLPSAPSGHVMPSLFVSHKNSLNISITLRRESTSGFLSSSTFCCCPKFSPPELLLTTPPLFYNILCPSCFCAGISTQEGEVVIHPPPIYQFLQLPKLLQGSRFNVLHRRGVTRLEEELDLLVDTIHNVRPKETVSCEGLVIFTLKEINVTRPCYHRS